MVYLMVVVGSLMVPLNRYFESLALVGTPSADWLYSPVNIVAVFSLFVFMISTSIGLRSLQGDFKNP
jgi:hypothetical protein